MVLERSHAEEDENVRVVERADLLYISGGKPARLLAALEGSPLWGGFLHARREGAWLVGSSAGAMALGDWTLVHRPEDGDGTPTQWMPGLGMLQGMAVVPHFDAWHEAEWLTAHGVDALVAEAKAAWEARAHIGDLEAVRHRSRAGEAITLTDASGLGAFRVLEWTV